VLRDLAAALGWKRLRTHRRRTKDGVNGAKSFTCTWYESHESDDIWLQINETPNGQQQWYEIAVYAFEDGLCTGWFRFKLPRTSESMSRLARRLKSHLQHDHFTSTAARKWFSQQFPECTGFGSKRAWASIAGWRQNPRRASR
jgi:hypothetical protein